jgi:tRNA dimethylallyltransferase
MPDTAPIRAVCLMGPTASGKTGHAIELSKRYPFELISVDSAQVYREMDIGTAKPTPAVLDAYPHRLINIREPWESYSAGDFCRDAVVAMQEITAAGRIPLLVGGTMLYFQALQRGIAPMPAADPDLRASLDRRAAAEGWPALHAQLSKLDPVTAARLQPTDAQRIQRALEVCMLAGEPMSELHNATQPPVQADYLNIALLPSDRDRLHQHIAARFMQMVEQGLLAEVRALSELPGISAGASAMRSVGYRQFWSHINGEISLDEAVERAIIATRQLAKRQLTWLRSWPDMHAIDSFSDDVGTQMDGILDSWFTSDASADISS